MLVAVLVDCWLISGCAAFVLVAVLVVVLFLCWLLCWLIAG